MQTSRRGFVLCAKDNKPGDPGRGNMQTSDVISDLSQGQLSIVRVLRCIPPTFVVEIDFAFLIHRWFSGLPYTVFVDIGSR